MSREILSFLVFFVMLALVFRFGGENWRDHQQAYRQAALAMSWQQWHYGSTARPPAPPADSLLEILEEAGLSTRLQRLADSLEAVRADLAGIRNVLLAARDGLSAMEAGETGKDQYFAAVRSFRRSDGLAAGIEHELDSLKRGLRALGQLSRRQSAGPLAQVRWLDPSRVPVREACTTCHFPLGDGERVMLYPDSTYVAHYPEAMATHDFRQFGCTVCHGGAPAALDFHEAHGPDYLLRPFRPGQLAFRACGLCHADRSPLATDRVTFVWPDACIGCHQGESPLALAGSADNPALSVPVGEPELRNWLLRHWAESSGVIPPRDQFEAALSMLVSGDVRGSAKERAEVPAVGGNSLGPGGEGTCPRCGRNFRISLKAGEAFCPVDGARLVTVREKQ